MKKYILVLLLSFFLVGCQPSDSIESPEQEIKNTILDVFETAFTIQYEYINELMSSRSNELKEIGPQRMKEVEHAFTSEFVYSPGLNYFMTSGNPFVINNRCNISVESLDIILKDTESPEILVCDFTVTVKLDYIDANKKNDLAELSGVITLYNIDNEWKIGFIRGSRRTGPDIFEIIKSDE